MKAVSAMKLDELFADKTIKAKARVKQVGDWLLNGKLSMRELIAFSKTQTGTDKATCIEAMEYATKKDATIADEKLLAFVTAALKEEEPRIKWESAKVVGNIAKLFPTQQSKVVRQLLINARHIGSVVRWATAYALAEIIKLETSQNKKLLPEIELLLKKEKDSGVKKKYLDALKKIKK